MPQHCCIGFSSERVKTVMSFAHRRWRQWPRKDDGLTTWTSHAHRRQWPATTLYRSCDRGHMTSPPDWRWQVEEELESFLWQLAKYRGIGMYYCPETKLIPLNDENAHWLGRAQRQRTFGKGGIGFLGNKKRKWSAELRSVWEREILITGTDRPPIDVDIRRGTFS